MTATELPRSFRHAPVLVEEVVRAFDFGRRATIVDGTLGLGGHAEALLAAYPDLSMIGIEWDAQALSLAKEKLGGFGPRLRFVPGSYAHMPELLSSIGLTSVEGILLDLGVSSLQLDDPSRGFSFQSAGPLDMRMSPELSMTAWEIVMTYDEEELARVLYSLGDERHSRRVARALKTAIERGELANDTGRVADVIRRAIPGAPGRINPATRSFQALRMEVNHELDNIKTFLAQCRGLLEPGGRLAIIAFHSLEDRLVKQAFQAAAKGCLCPPRLPQCVCGLKPWGKLVARKAIRPTDEEVARNPRSRSARLRILEKQS